MTTVQNAFKVNGVLLAIQPSDHGWTERRDYGRDGAGHAILPATREYKLEWGSMTPAEFYELVNNYNSFGITGTVVVQLPQWGNSTYQFIEYSGTVVNEPTYSGFFENQYQGVRLLITSIRT